jgi:hypothetical protein
VKLGSSPLSVCSSQVCVDVCVRPGVGVNILKLGVNILKLPGEQQPPTNTHTHSHTLTHTHTGSQTHAALTRPHHARLTAPSLARIIYLFHSCWCVPSCVPSCLQSCVRFVACSRVSCPGLRFCHPLMHGHAPGLLTCIRRGNSSGCFCLMGASLTWTSLASFICMSPVGSSPSMNEHA